MSKEKLMEHTSGTLKKKLNPWKGEFKIKKSPNPEILLKDWPSTFENLRWLDDRMDWIVAKQPAMPESQISAIQYKLKYMRKDLRKRMLTIRKSV